MNAKEEFKEMLQAEHEAKYPEMPYRYLGKWTDKTANGLTAMVIKYLKLQGWQAERISVTGRKVDNRKVVTNVIGQKQVIGSAYWLPSSMQKGSADISATIAGRSVKIEVKIGKDRQSKDQKAYQKQIEQAGGVYIIARDFAGFVNWYKEFTQKCTHRN